MFCKHEKKKALEINRNFAGLCREFLMLLFLFALISLAITTRLELESGCSLRGVLESAGFVFVWGLFFLDFAADLLIFAWDTGPCPEHLELSSFPTNPPCFPWD